MSRQRRAITLLLPVGLLLAGCGGGDVPTDTTDDAARATDAATTPTTVTLLTHESFALTQRLLDDFADESGITIEVLTAGDAGAVVNQAILTAGNPQADVLFGVDNNLLARALEADLFEPYASPLLDAVDPSLLPATDAVTPIDRGDVCLNVDREFFASAGIDPPASLDDLRAPEYAGMLVVEDPTTSSPGLAFLLATIDRYGDDWPAFWADLVANDVVVAAGWSEAYYGEFSGGAGEGDRPIVVSYASSPAAEVVFGDPDATEAPTAAVLDSCYRQVEYAGVLRGTDAPVAARRVVDFLLSEDVQADVPLQMFVFPARTDVALPDVFARHARVADDAAVLAPEEVAANEAEWLATWREVVLG